MTAPAPSPSARSPTSWRRGARPTRPSASAARRSCRSTSGSATSARRRHPRQDRRRPGGAGRARRGPPHPPRGGVAGLRAARRRPRARRHPGPDRRRPGGAGRDSTRPSASAGRRSCRSTSGSATSARVPSPWARSPTSWQARGEPDEALRIRREEELPVYERLGDVRSRAVTLGKIADVLAARGETRRGPPHPPRGGAAGLRAARRRPLPRRHPRPDRRRPGGAGRDSTRPSASAARSSCRSTSGSATSASAPSPWARSPTSWQARGELDEALRIRREEELPVYERLGDVRSRAVTLGQIADVLAARGETDEALRIRREEELPVYERLGDVRSRAVTLGKIADVLAARGETDEALRILRDESLPTFRKLDEPRPLAQILDPSRGLQPEKRTDGGRGTVPGGGPPVRRPGGGYGNRRVAPAVLPAQRP